VGYFAYSNFAGPDVFKSCPRHGFLFSWVIFELIFSYGHRISSVWILRFYCH
jgi:hypothetical protein